MPVDAHGYALELIDSHQFPSVPVNTGAIGATGGTTNVCYVGQALWSFAPPSVLLSCVFFPSTRIMLQHIYCAVGSSPLAGLRLSFLSQAARGSVAILAQRVMLHDRARTAASHPRLMGNKFVL